MRPANDIWNPMMKLEILSKIMGKAIALQEQFLNNSLRCKEILILPEMYIEKWYFETKSCLASHRR